MQKKSCPALNQDFPWFPSTDPLGLSAHVEPRPRRPRPPCRNRRGGPARSRWIERGYGGARSRRLDRIRIDRTHITGSNDPVNPVYIDKVEQNLAVDGIADGNSNQPQFALGRPLPVNKMKPYKKFPSDIAANESSDIRYEVPAVIDGERRSEINKNPCVLFVDIRIQFEDVSARTIDETLQYRGSAVRGKVLDNHIPLSRKLPDVPEKYGGQ